MKTVGGALREKRRWLWVAACGVLGACSAARPSTERAWSERAQGREGSSSGTWEWDGSQHNAALAQAIATRQLQAETEAMVRRETEAMVLREAALQYPVPPQNWNGQFGEGGLRESEDLAAVSVVGVQLAGQLRVGSSVRGTLTAGDVQVPGTEARADDYVLLGAAGQTIELLARGEGSGGLDTVVRVYVDGVLRSENDDAEGTEDGRSRVVWTVPEEGNVVVRVTSYGSEQRFGTYHLSVQARSTHW